MNAKRIRLINAARKALFQRTQVTRSARDAKANFAPQALKTRAQKQISRGVEDVVDSAERELRRYTVPLGLAALAGLAFAFRRPLAGVAQVVSDQVSDAATALTEHFASLSHEAPVSPLDNKDHDHEPV